MTELRKFDREHVMPMHRSGQNFIDLAKREIPEKLALRPQQQLHFFRLRAIALHAAAMSAFGVKRTSERCGVPIALGSRAFDVLRVLVENSGQVVEKWEFLRRVWPNHIVEDGGPKYQIAVLRRC